MIPREHTAAVTKSLESAFGITEYDDIQALVDRPEANRVYRITVQGNRYLLRINTRAGDMPRQFTAMQAAAGIGLAPKVLYANATDRISITAFVDAKPFPAHEALVLIPHALRALHALAPFPTAPFNTTCTFLLTPGVMLEGFLQRFRASQLLGEDEKAQLLMCHQRLAETYASLPADRVPSHNDLFKPDNMLFDGNRLWLVDWEAAFQNDRYADLAAVANMIVTSEDEETQYLAEYFGKPPDEYQRARFYLMSQLAHVFYAMAFLAPATSPSNIDHYHPGLTYAEYQKFYWTGDITLSSNDARILFGLVHWKALSHDMRQPRFQQALQKLTVR